VERSLVGLPDFKSGDRRKATPRTQAFLGAPAGED